jgi:hypothetical protein
MAGIAFIVLSNQSDPAKHRTVLQTPTYDLTVVAVPDYKSAVHVAKELFSEGIEIIELCGGFGNLGTAEVARAIPGAHLGVVRFDGHPGLNGASGDAHYLLGGDYEKE